jgi:hypothetical protein
MTPATDRSTARAASRGRWKRILAAAGSHVIAVALFGGSVAPLRTDVAAADGTGGRPYVFAYYYIWFTHGSWARAKEDLPALGRYDSDDRAAVRQHMAWLQQAGVDGLIVSWKHEDRLDAPLKIVIEEANKAGIELVLLYQGLDFERQPIEPDRIATDIRWFLDTYHASPTIAPFGRPAVVWSGTWKFSDDEIARVRSAIGAPDRVLLFGSERSAAEYAARADLFDGDAYYWSSPDPLETPKYTERLADLSAAVHADSGIWIAPAAPGFDARLVGGKSVVPRRDGETYRAAWAGAIASGPDAVGIISWNEFSENSHIEPSQTMSTTYLDLTGELIRALGTGEVAPVRPTPGGSFAWDRASLIIVTLVGVAIIAMTTHLRRRPES